MLEIAAAVAGAAVAAGAVTAQKRRSARERVERERAEAESSVVGVREAARKGIEAARRQGSRQRERLEADLEALQEAVESDAERLDRLEAAVDRRAEQLGEREAMLGERFDLFKSRREAVRVRASEVDEIEVAYDEAVEQRAGATRQAVIDEIGASLSDSARVAAQRAANAMEAEAQSRAEQEARRLMDLACYRYGVALPANRLVARVALPRKAAQRDRLVAESGAVLHAITEHTAVEFVEQEGDQYHLHAPDPYTREVGRLTYERMLKSGNISVEAVVKGAAKAARDLEKTCRDAGNRAAKVLGIRGVDREILFLVGKLLYRTSYTQNQWQHAIETAHLCGMMAEDLGMDVVAARRSGLMHDIGKVLWAETEAVGSHAVSGAAFATAHGESPEIVHPIAAHHGDEKPSTPLAHLVAAADALSGARPGARRETVESYAGRLEELQRICGDYTEIKKSFIMSGGREVRIEVDPRRTDDRAALRLSDDVARRIEDECIYPGQIKVTVIREVRSQAVAR